MSNYEIVLRELLIGPKDLYYPQSKFAYTVEGTNIKMWIDDKVVINVEGPNLESAWKEFLKIILLHGLTNIILKNQKNEQ